MFCVINPVMQNCRERHLLANHRLGNRASSSSLTHRKGALRSVFWSKSNCFILHLNSHHIEFLSYKDTFTLKYLSPDGVVLGILFIDLRLTLEDIQNRRESIFSFAIIVTNPKLFCMSPSDSERPGQFLFTHSVTSTRLDNSLVLSSSKCPLQFQVLCFFLCPLSRPDDFRLYFF